MKNPEIGRAYMQKTFYELSDIFALGHGEEGDPGEPLKFKVYQDLPRYPLCQALPLTVGDPRQAFPAFAQTYPDSTDTKLDFLTLSTLLYYTFGFSRHDSGSGVRWPFHRLVPSARCFYPTELYLWIPQIDALPAGIYHYDNLHHSLVCLRQGEYRDTFSTLAGADLDDSAAILLISAHFWKNAFRYRNFSYRLCSQEAGLVAGNALLVAGTLGLQGHIHYQFLDRTVNHLLGFQPLEESLFSIIPLYPKHSSPTQARLLSTSAEDMLAQIEPISPRYIQPGTLDPQLCSLFVEMDQLSFMESTDEFATSSNNTIPACDKNEARLLPPPPLNQGLEMAEALHQRHSGDMLFIPLQKPLALEAFWEIIRYSLSPYQHDLCTQEAGLNAQLYIAVNHVEGLPQGLYRLCPTCGALHVVEQRDVTLDTFRIHSTSTVSCHTACMVCYIVGNYDALAETHGNRSYRIMNMESGIVAQRLCVMSAAFGLAARCSDSYNMQRCEEFLRLTDQPALPVFLVAIGYERPGPGARYRHTIRF